jgi:hypothetical protein
VKVGVNRLQNSPQNSVSPFAIVVVHRFVGEQIACPYDFRLRLTEVCAPSIAFANFAFFKFTLQYKVGPYIASFRI